MAQSTAPILDFTELIGDPTYADAILDRIVHNAQRINLTGHSLRRSRANKTSKEGYPCTHCADIEDAPSQKNAPPAFLRARFVDPAWFCINPAIPAQSPASRSLATALPGARSLAASLAAPKLVAQSKD